MKAIHHIFCEVVIAIYFVQSTITKLKWLGYHDHMIWWYVHTKYFGWGYIASTLNPIGAEV